MLPIVIYGPTASGKSGLALKLAARFDAAIVNADALQVYSNWQILSARPDERECALAPHYLYGHVAPDQPYSTGAWLREVGQLLSTLDQPIIVVGGTGLYLTALTQGLADIPETPTEVREAGNVIRESEGASGLVARLETLDPVILTRIDRNNPMRLQRAWEVATATGTPLSAWQAQAPEPLLPPAKAHLMCLSAPADWQCARIDQRFDAMIAQGALEECRAALAAGWEPNRPSSQAIGAAQLISHLQGEMSLDAAMNAAKTATHQYAKRQRTWMKNRMKSWVWLNSDDPNLFDHALEQIENSASKESVN